ncbi:MULTISPECIES: helix-turn-helix domain-containing protein [unclassified Micromonospora]|uniref:helix-turn-helix domain-containing protein n=1 Tax=unclassified Micromonospora TaxID=2617518 RepID=UPI00363D2E57
MTPPTPPGPEPLGPLLARLRQARGRSQQDLAAELCAASGVPTLSRHEVSRWERQLRVPGGFWLGWLAVVLATPVELLADAAGRSRLVRHAHEPAVRRHSARAGTPPTLPDPLRDAASSPAGPPDAPRSGEPLLGRKSVNTARGSLRKGIRQRLIDSISPTLRGPALPDTPTLPTSNAAIQTAQRSTVEIEHSMKFHHSRVTLCYRRDLVSAPCLRSPAASFSVPSLAARRFLYCPRQC